MIPSGENSGNNRCGIEGAIMGSTEDAQPLEMLGLLLRQLDDATKDPRLATLVGDGILRELRYPISSFKQRFPAAWPGGQQQLL